jgi:hypothetical protein
MSTNAERSRFAAATGALLVILSASWPSERVAAQNDVAPADSLSGGCFRGRPLPACRSFLVFEIQKTQPLVQTRRTIFEGPGGPVYPIPEFGEGVEWTLGLMWNVSSRIAVGGAFTTGLGVRTPLGVRLRGRRWLSDEISVELEGGLLRETGDWPSTGWSLGTRLNVQDRVSFFGRWDALDLRADQPYHPVDGGVQHAFTVGAGLGSRPAVIGTGVLGAVWVLLIVLIVTDDDYT